MTPDLEILSATIAAHARKLADEEWNREHREFLSTIIANAGIGEKGTISVDGCEIPIERIVAAIRERFLESRSRRLTQKLTDSIVSAAFKKVMDDEGNQ